jgi:type III pantothenate kinase
MLLAVDIGNTNIVFGVHDGEAWRHHWRIHTSHHSMADEYVVMFRHLFAEVNLDFANFSNIVLSSVVPQLTGVIVEMFNTRCQITPLIVDYRANTGLEICVDPPEQLGSDLIANAAAAYHRFQENCIVVDFGTATTMTAIEKGGRLLGCAVTAGLQTTAKAISNQASQLPQIALDLPPSVIGNNTIHAMQSGLVYGHIAMVEGLLDRMKKELDGAKVIATGGLATTIGHLTDRFDAIETWLTLDGLKLIATKTAS